MDKLLSVHEKKPTKQTNRIKKNTIKVVYISNPMKVNTTASEFRALVQELTGQDAKYSEIGCVGGNQMVSDEIKINGGDHHDDDHDHALEEVPRLMEPTTSDVAKSSDLAFEQYDDVFMPQMIENFSGFLPSSLLF
ncbi:hypothetical protein LOK49_LG10G02674 [Camellia lanceoleosa]|uniref:Uncharacterized protein n=1 Tax=Camellia lanceoleosa TaxID=1840588 RepID=A0ACC0G6C3_9ERIC|nr:hypothetical protein LOK49_LG10G02674 [Camellia lanceoleosa]